VSGAASRQLFGGLTEKELAQSIAKVRANQKEAIQRIMVQRLKVLDAEIESAMAASRARLAPEHEVILHDAIEQTRIPFDKMAPRAGQLTLELTNLIGFPDRGQPYRMVNATWSMDRAKRVQEIRAELERMNTQYLAERNAILDQAYRRIARDEEALKQNAIVARKEGEERIIEALAQLSDRNEDQNQEQKPLGGAQLRLPATPGGSVRVNSSEEELPRLSGTPVLRSPRWTAEQKAKIWAGAKGYQLVSREEGRDATAECIKWIKEQAAGH
jgi:hypothetical protein